MLVFIISCLLLSGVGFSVFVMFLYIFEIIQRKHETDMMMNDNGEEEVGQNVG
jgi:hypothetical protein